MPSLSLGLGVARGFSGPSVPSAATATFGAKTIAGAGAFRPVDSFGFPLNLASYNSLVSGSLGVYTPSISGGGLRFTGAAGAPAGAVLRCTLALGGTIDITIAALEANTYSCATLTEANAAYGAAVLGDTIRLRAGSHNSTAARVIVGRASSPSGTWTGTSILSDGNWVMLTRDPGAIVTIGALEIGSGGGTHARYLRVHDLDFVSPSQADGNGIGTGVSAGVSGQLTLSVTGGGHVAVTNCRFSHTTPIVGTSVGMFRAMHSANVSTAGPFWIEGNTINGARHGIIGGNVGSVIRNNTIRRILSDCAQIGHCTGMLFEGNFFTDKIYGYTPLTITGITRGTSTVITVADTSAVIVGEILMFSGVSGSFGAGVNDRTNLISAKTATTITVNFDSSALANWDGVAGQVFVAFGIHGDYLQFNENLGATPTQDNVTIRGNRFYRGFTDGVDYVDGQGVFGGGTGTTANRSNWLIEGNIYVGLAQRGISVSKLVNPVIRSNTIVRVLGIDGNSGNSIPSIVITSDSTGATLLDNISNGFVLDGTITQDLNSNTITIVNVENKPTDSANVTAYQGAFVNPDTVANVALTASEVSTKFATRTDTGGTFNGFDVFPGATPYFNFSTLTFTNPRVPAAMAAPTSAARSRSTALTITKAADPNNRGYAITDYDLRHSPDGTTWTTVTNPTFPYDITGLTPGQNYHIQTRANNVNGKGAWGASVQDKTSLVDFTATPTSSVGVTAAAITDGWEFVTNAAAGARAGAWSIDGVLGVGVQGTFTFTIEITSITDATSIRSAANSILSAVRGGLDSSLSLTANTPTALSRTITSATSDTDWLGFLQAASTGAKTIRLTNLKLVSP